MYGKCNVGETTQANNESYAQKLVTKLDQYIY